MTHKALSSCLPVTMLMLCGLSPLAEAGVVIDGTRQVYPQHKREITVRLTNDDRLAPRLVQAWIDRGERAANPSSSDVPFSLSPPVFRLDPGKSQAMRVVYTREPLPADRESVFWLNVLEVPPRVETLVPQGEPFNYLQFAFRIRTKVFFRPPDLPGTPDEAPALLRWTLRRDTGTSVLEVHNPSAFHVTFNEVALALGSQADAPRVPAEEGMVAPGGHLKLAIRRAVGKVPSDAGVHFKYINDFGAFSAPQRAPLTF